MHASILLAERRRDEDRGWTNSQVWFMNTTIALIFTLPASLLGVKQSWFLWGKVCSHSFRLSLSNTQTQWEKRTLLCLYLTPPFSLSCLVAQRSICADFLKGLQGVTWTEWMGLIAFSKVEADLYKRKWIECCFFFTPYPMLPVMHLRHFVKLCHFVCFQHFLLFS